MMRRAACVALISIGCSSVQGTSLEPSDDEPQAPEAPVCEVSLGFDPAEPVARPSTKIRVYARTTAAPGVIDYRWFPSFEGAQIPYTPAQIDGSQIDIEATRAGAYVVVLTPLGTSCGSVSVTINVRAPDARDVLMRLRVLPPPAVVAPAFERLITVSGGASTDLGVVVVDSGMTANVTVTGPSGGVPAYLRFSPRGSPEAIVEAFSDAAGRTSARIAAGRHDVLIVPSTSTAAPTWIEQWTAGSALVVSAGDLITGSVRDPADAPLAGAVVQLEIAGVPSTVATTASDGSFALRATGAGQATVEVAPPAASGLPRLTAALARGAGAPIAIRYASELVRRDLAGTRIRRDGSAIGHARVTVVGAIESAGTVAWGGAPVAAIGEVRIAATANASGVLPTARVPAARLSVVIASAEPFAVAALDTRTGVPEEIEAPAAQPITTTLTSGGGAPLRGAIVDFVPTGALAKAAAPTLHATANGGGAISASLAANGRYELRLRDPAGRAAPLVVADLAAATIAERYALPAGVVVRGALLLGGTQPLPGALVQIVCDDCSGLDRARPLAEVVADTAGRFQLTVPDPGSR